MLVVYFRFRVISFQIHPVSATRSIRGVAMLVPPSLEDLVPRLDVSAEMGPVYINHWP